MDRKPSVLIVKGLGELWLPTVVVDVVSCPVLFCSVLLHS